MSIKDTLWLITFLTALILFMTLFALIPDIYCIIKHRTYSTPPNYEIVTNGESYSIRQPGGHINIYTPHLFKRQAITAAWRDYRREEKKRKQSIEQWEFVQ